MNTVKEFAPNLSRDIDYYKITMGQVIFERHPNEQVTFTLKNRAHEQPLSQYVSPEALQQRLDRIREQGFTAEEIAYYASIMTQNGEAQFTPEYLDNLANLELPAVNIGINPESGDLAIDSTGNWVDVTFWETVVMSETNELYYEQLMESHGLNLQDLYDEGDHRLDEKIEKLRTYPGIKFADFGTRRRFSANWHEHVVARLAKEMPDQFIGSSNPWFAYKYGLKPIGTFAHEMPMVYAGLADAEGRNPLDGHKKMLEDWDDTYDGGLSTALSDTYTSEFFFNDFTAEQARKWTGLRHDSGDPIEFGERAIEFYEQHAIDPTTKTIVFSDGLDVDTIIELYKHFEGRVNVLFGWGTNLMNDLGLPANNFVMKATRVNGTYTVKLSDNEGKHTGPPEEVDKYLDRVDVANKLAKAGMHEMVHMA